MKTWITVSLSLAGALAMVCPVSAETPDGKGADIGGPAESRSKRRRFGVDPAALTDAEKAERLAAISTEYESLRRNQDILQTRTRRNRVVFVGEMRYPASGPFLKKVFEGDRDKRTRVAALVAIGRSGDFATIQDVAKQAIAVHRKESVYYLSLPRMFRGCDSPEAGEWLLGRLPQKDAFLTAAIVEAIGYTSGSEALPVLDDLLVKAKHPAVLFEVLRAYGSCGKKAAIDKLLPYLDHEDWRLRMAAAEGLGRTGETPVIADLAKLIVEGQVPIVIETATEAVAALGGKDAVEPLIECLKVGRLRARNKARLALVDIARREFRQRKDYFTDPNAWKAWWKKARNPGTGVGQTPTAAKHERETISYFGFKIHSDAVLFILDTSGSMKWPDAPRESGLKPSEWHNRRINLAHREMFRTLRQLNPKTLFNVASFAGVTTPWQKTEVPATPENVEIAIKWIQGQLPGGGTATYDALAFGVEATNVDTIYFLSDGVPSLGRYEEPETILAELRKINRYRRVSINTIALIVGKSPNTKALKYEDPEDMGDFMGRIAEENYGAFADESRPLD